MAKPEWGVKRFCGDCGARFYDLGRDPIICPKCGVTYDPVVLGRSQRAKAVVSPAPKPKPKPEPVSVEAEETAETGDDDLLVEVAGESNESDASDASDASDEGGEDEEAIEDASELGEDKDDILEVIENVEGDKEPEG